MQLLCKSLAFLLSCVSWALSMGIAKSTSWLVWEFDSSVIPVVFIGLWETFYHESCNISGYMVEVPVHAMLNQSWLIPSEIYYGQELMFLVNLMMPLSLVFASVAFWASWGNEPYPEFSRVCYNISALFLSVSCFFTTLTVGWIFSVDLYGQTTLEFPPHFPVGKQMIKSKCVSCVLPVGITAATLALVSAGLFFFHGCAITGWYTVKHRAVYKHLKEKV